MMDRAELIFVCKFVHVDLIFQHVQSFFSQIFCVCIHDFEVTRASFISGDTVQIPARGTFDEARPVGIGFVDLGPQFLREHN